MDRQLYACKECREHFKLLPEVLETTDHFICDYHTDYTGRAIDASRLLSEWLSGGDAAVAVIQSNRHKQAY